MGLRWENFKSGLSTVLGKEGSQYLLEFFVLVRFIFVFFVIASSIFFQSNLVKWPSSEVQTIDAGDQLK